MRLLVLSRNSRLYSTRRLAEAGRQRGHTMRVVDYLRCRLETQDNQARVVFNNKPLDDYDAVIPRIGASRTHFGAAVVQHFETAGVLPANNADAIKRSRDKLRALQVLVAAGLGIPNTAFGHSSRSIEGLIEAVGGAPVIIKLTEGSRGAGVVLAETQEAAESVITALHMLEGLVLVQSFVKEADGRDIRAFVVGDEVVASMVRIAKDGEFRANLHRGATAESIELSDEEKEMSVRAAQAMGLHVAGVDFLRGNDGPLFLEVNSSPGLEGIEHYTGVDVAGAIIEHTEAMVAAQDTQLTALPTLLNQPDPEPLSPMTGVMPVEAAGDHSPHGMIDRVERTAAG